MQTTLKEVKNFKGMGSSEMDKVISDAEYLFEKLESTKGFNKRSLIKKDIDENFKIISMMYSDYLNKK